MAARAESMALAIEAEGIVKTYGKAWWSKKRKSALKGVDLRVEGGEIFGILGPNGAGKTTLLSILSTLLLPDRGTVRIFGIDGLRHGHAVRQKVNISSGNANFLWSLTIKENLHFYGMLYGLVGKERAKKVDSLIELLDLKEHRDVSFDQLSTGTKQRLSLAKSLINDPALLFLDEPTVGLDPSVSIRIRDEIRAIQKKRGVTVLLTTHNMKEAEYLCDRIAFLKEGEILTVGTAEALKRMVRIGDMVKIEFTGKIPDDGLALVDGVINYTVSDGHCEVLVDEGEKRLGALVAMLCQSGVRIDRVTMRQTDLEDVFVEFAKGTGTDEPLGSKGAGTNS
jgi:ABC-2 type transport system ATP-binding protein